MVGWKGIIKAAGQSEINGNTKVAGRRVMTEQDIKTKQIITIKKDNSKLNTVKSSSKIDKEKVINTNSKINIDKIQDKSLSHVKTLAVNKKPNKYIENKHSNMYFSSFCKSNSLVRE